MNEKIRNDMLFCVFFFVVLGMMSCGSAERIVLDPESRDFYETAQLIMTKEEKNIFHHLPDEESREEFIQDFWLKRDPNPETEKNEFKDEFFSRIDYANMHFREGPPGWKSDRGRIYIYLGPPDKFDEIFTHNEVDYQGKRIRGSILLWIYYRYNLGIKFVDTHGNGHFTLDPAPFEMGGGVFGSLSDAIDMAKLGLNLEEGFSEKYLNFDVQFESDKKEIVVSIPVKGLTFIEEEGLLRADFDFEFHIYEKDSPKKKLIKVTKSFRKPEDEVFELKNIIFNFPCDLKPGEYYLDVVVIGKGSIAKTRKIFRIKF